jgi:uncharacterized membrane protein YgcG
MRVGLVTPCVQSSVRPTPGRLEVTVRSSLAVLAVLVFVVLGAGPASAEPPVELSGAITDEVGVLGGDAASVQQSVDELVDARDVTVHAVFVRSFGTADDVDWVAETAALSGLGESDVLLAVAVGDGDYEYGWWIDDESVLRPARVQGVVDGGVVPQLDAGNWAAAVIALADGLQPRGGPASEASSWSAAKTLVVVGCAAGVLVAGHLLSRRRRPVGSP